MIFVCVRACYDVQYNIRRNESNACSEDLNTRFSSCSARRKLRYSMPCCHCALQTCQTLASHLNILSADGRALCPWAATSSWVRFIKWRQAHDLSRPVVRKPHMRLFGIVDWSIGSQKALIEVCESKMRRVSVPLGAPCYHAHPHCCGFLHMLQLNVLPQHHTAENIYSSRRGPRTR